MDDAIQLFSNDEFGTIRAINVDGEPMLVAKDVADILGYRDAANMLRSLDDDEKGTHAVSTPGGKQRMALINESGFYRIVLQRKLGCIDDEDMKKSVEDFQRWVTHDILPSIRKHGAYMTPVTIDAIIADPAFGIRLLTELQTERERNRSLLEENCKLVPKAQFYDNLMDSDGLLSVRDAAKILKSYDQTIGEKRLRQNLRDDCMVEKRTTKATSVAIERGYMRERPFSFKHSDGHETFDHYGCLTPKGLDWCKRRYCDQHMFDFQ